MSRRALSLLVAIALTLVMAVAAGGVVQAAPSKDKAQERAKHARIVKYWTPARMAKATPRDFVKQNGRFVPVAKGGNAGKPGGGGNVDGGGDSTSTVVTGASWTQGGPALTGTGKVFFSMAGSNYVCSGATVDDGNRGGYSMVLTAGHCAYDESNGAFATNWMFIPEYDTSPTRTCANTEHGCYTAAALVVHKNYATAGGFNSQAIKHDWAFAVVGAGSQGGQLDAAVPDFGIGFDAVNEDRYAFGYPASGKYAGSDLVYCAGGVTTDPSLDTWGLRCDMTPGSSGGPWMKDFDTSTKSGTLNSLNSYKYNGGRLKNYMFGPKFGPRTQAVYNAARSATSNQTVN
jgi:hypothetical protein